MRRIKKRSDRRKTPITGKMLLKTMQKDFAEETKRIANEARKTKDPLARKLMEREVKRRKQIAKGNFDGKIIKMEG